MREDIRAKLWPEGVHVDFEQGINVAVARLRRALSDSGTRPLYLERVPGVGYRFVAPLIAKQAPATAAALPEPQPLIALDSAPSLMGKLNRATLKFNLLLFGLPALLLTVFWSVQRSKSSLSAPEISTIGQLTK